MRKPQTTAALTEQYYGLAGLLETWEKESREVQIREHDYLLALRAKLRSVKNRITHRADPHANV